MRSFRFYDLGFFWLGFFYAAITELDSDDYRYAMHLLECRDLHSTWGHHDMTPHLSPVIQAQGNDGERVCCCWQVVLGDHVYSYDS
jgi:hypothetical protein